MATNPEGAPEAPQSVEPRISRRLDMALGLTILISGFAGCMALSLWALDLSTPKEAPRPAPPSGAGIPGFPNAVRPLELISEARALTSRTLFTGLSIQGMHQDGTVNLTGSGGHARYVFQDPRGIGAQPPRKGGTLPERTYCGKQYVQLGDSGLGAQADVAAGACSTPPPEALPPLPPACSVAQLMKLAGHRKFNLKGIVDVDYYRAEAGPALRVRQGRRQYVVLAKDCTTVIHGRAERGHVP